MNTAWDVELGAFLTELSSIQEETLHVLEKKRKLLMGVDTAGLAELAPQEDSLIERLQGCLKTREDLLQKAGKEGLPAVSLTELTQALPRDQKKQLAPDLEGAAARMRLLRHHSLTNWVLVQRTLLHLGQMLEIIATGGRPQPTYGKGEPACATGSLADWAA
jgi:hypothetical protein